ncbi:transcription initiation factor TFIID subunit 4 [Microplitis demolitor]|uniref:transcription initiation factor TFIID subunit 4 n=1 Tax=Microplitis demolitor TaxID=69319 RepID=UPI0004CD5C90|nr:transcription initiation factor TFIID subunit 4 [Microplitis demolitor]
MSLLCPQNQPLTSQDNNYQPHVGTLNVSTTPNSIYGSQVTMNQHQQYLQISIVADNPPMANSDAGQHQPAYKVTSSQANIKNVIVNNNSTGQVNTPNLIADNNNNNNNNNNDNNNNNNNNYKPTELIIPVDKLSSPQLGQLNIPMNSVQKTCPELYRKIYKKTEHGYQLNSISSLAPKLQNNVYIKTQHGYQLLKISIPEAGTQSVSQTAQAGSTEIKTTASTTPTSVVYSVASPASAATADPGVPTLTKTKVLPISLNKTTPKISTTFQSDQQKVMINKMVQKCCVFFNNLLAEASTIQQGNTRNVKSNLTKLIQDVIDNKIEAKQFADRLELMLNAVRQPLLVDFLTKSLPQLRTSLYLKQMTIHGIRPPPPTVALSTLQLAPTSVKQQSLIKSKVKSPVSDNPSRQLPVTTTIPPARITIPSGFVMMPPASAATPRTTWAMPPATLAMPSAIVTKSSTTVTIPPRTLSIASTTLAMSPATVAMPSTTVTKPSATVAIPSRTLSIPSKTLVMPTATVTMPSARFMVPPTTVTKAPATTQIKPYQSSSKSVRPTKKLVRTDNLKPTPVVGTKITKTIGHQSPLTTTSNIQQLPTIFNPTIQQSSTHTSANFNKFSEDNKKINIAIGVREKKTDSSIKTNEDELNDVITMGGIDIAEESKAILSSTEKVGTKVRSCKEKLFLNSTSLQNKIKQMLLKHGLEGAESDVIALVSHATEQRLRGLVEKMSTISEHRLDFNRNDPRYEVTQDVRAQLRFLQEVDKAAVQKREAKELALMLKASKRKSKDDEQIKLKEKAKEMQKAEMEKKRQRDADITALQALGPRKKPRFDADMTSSAASGLSRQPFRPRTKKICMKDLLFVLQEEQSSCRSTFLYKSYLKY